MHTFRRSILGVFIGSLAAACSDVESTSRESVGDQGSAAEGAAGADAASKASLPYRHPLVEASGRALAEEHFRARPGASALSFLRDHMVVAGERGSKEKGPATRSTGVVRVHRERVPGHVPSPEPEGPVLSMDEPVKRWLADASSRPAGKVELALGVLPGWDPTVSVPHALRIAMVEGRLRTHGDAARVRAETRAAKRAAGAAALAPLASAVAAMGGRVVAKNPSAGTLTVELPSSMLPAIVQHPKLGRIEVATKVEDDAGVAYDVDGTRIDGRELEDLLQTTQYYDRGYEGDDAERIAVVEGGAATVFNDHPGFDGRYTNCGDDGAGACNWAHPTVGSAHATATASVLLGDITAGQDAAITTDLEQRERSGVAREGRGRGMTGGDFQFLSDRLTAYNDTHLLTQSASSNNDPQCRGETTGSRNWNSLYEDGYALFNSAGNNGHSNSNDCTVASPATAIGVFAVGAYVIDGNDAEAIYSMSDQGGNGTPQEGRHRTIIDVLGPSGMEYAYPHYAWPEDANGDEFQYGTEWASGPGPSGFCCTSSSTPAIAGSAALFRQWFTDAHGSAIDDPGLLYANLLLMGDRRRAGLTPAMTVMGSGFDGLYGAGKFRLRIFDADGLDYPASWSTGSACVDDGTDVYIDIGGVSDDVEILNTVASWYDRRHDDGTHHDNIDLEVQRSLNGGPWLAVRSSTTRDDKERVAVERPEPGTYRLRLRGERVTADDEGCGTNSMLVHWAYVAEDGDREAHEALDAVRPYPLSPVMPELEPGGTLSLP